MASSHVEYLPEPLSVRTPMTFFTRLWFEDQEQWIEKWEEKLELLRLQQRQGFYTRLGKLGVFAKVVRDNNNRKVRVFRLDSLVSAGILSLKDKLPRSMYLRKNYLWGTTIFVREEYIRNRMRTAKTVGGI